MKFVIVTGMSGAGKSTALRFLEDLGYYCVDNLPPALIPRFAEICALAEFDMDKVCLGMDVRGGRRLFEDIFDGLREVQKGHYDFSVLFLEASDEVLLNRYKETRRAHPLSKEGRIMDGIAVERELLAPLKARANYVVDTSGMLTRQLKEKMTEIFEKNKKFNSLIINIISFGYKYGIPSDADLVFDVRFIPNPFYIPALKHRTGEEDSVRSYVLSWDVAAQFLDKLKDMLDFLIPNYVREGKNQLVVAIGCTGGMHRSVVVAKELFATLQSDGHSVILNHQNMPGS